MKKIFKIYNRVGVFKLILIILKKLKIIKYTSLTEKKNMKLMIKLSI